MLLSHVARNSAIWKKLWIWLQCKYLWIGHEGIFFRVLDPCSFIFIITVCSHKGRPKPIRTSRSITWVQYPLTLVRRCSRSMNTSILDHFYQGLFANGDNFYRNKNWFHWQQWYSVMHLFVLVITLVYMQPILDYMKNSRGCHQVQTVRQSRSLLVWTYP